MKGLVLLVEDDLDDLDLTLAAFKLNRFPHRVEVARDGVAALARLRGPAERPALMIVDLNIPKISGLELLERLRRDKALASLPVVVLSSSDDIREKERAAALGALAFLRKPLSFNEFGKVIDELNRLLSGIRKKEARR